jgi:putative transposase
MAVVVHSANIHNNKSASCVLSELKDRFSRLVKIVAYGGYRGELVENARKAFGCIIEIVLRKNDSLKFQILPQRWIIKRTFACFESYRRLVHILILHLIRYWSNSLLICPTVHLP